MMRNKNVKTEGNSTLLKLQYGHRRTTRSAAPRRDSDDAVDRRLKSALSMRRPESSTSDLDDATLPRQESVSNFYSSNPLLSKASLVSGKKTFLTESYGHLQSKGFGSFTSTEDMVENSFDPEEEYDFDADGKIVFLPSSCFSLSGPFVYKSIFRPK